MYRKCIARYCHENQLLDGSLPLQNVLSQTLWRAGVRLWVACVPPVSPWAAVTATLTIWWTHHVPCAAGLTFAGAFLAVVSEALLSASVLLSSSCAPWPWLLLTLLSHYLLVPFFKHTLKLLKWTVNSLWKIYLHICFQLPSSVLSNTNCRMLATPTEKTAGLWLRPLYQLPRNTSGTILSARDLGIIHRCPFLTTWSVRDDARARVCVLIPWRSHLTWTLCFLTFLNLFYFFFESA